MAPEVIENKNYTLKADVFSFGVSLLVYCVDYYMGNMHKENTL
jgi:hypothetical protein